MAFEKLKNPKTEEISRFIRIWILLLRLQLTKTISLIRICIFLTFLPAAKPSRYSNCLFCRLVQRVPTRLWMHYLTWKWVHMVTKGHGFQICDPVWPHVTSCDQMWPSNLLYSNCLFSLLLRMFKKKPITATLTSENVSRWSTGHEKIYGKVIFGLGGRLEAKIASKKFASKNLDVFFIFCQQVLISKKASWNI